MAPYQVEGKAKKVRKSKIGKNEEDFLFICQLWRIVKGWYTKAALGYSN
jgi:hypothetical protein